ncbi:SOS response-associated peptidase [Devosia sp. A449]
MVADMGKARLMCGRFTNEITWAELHALYSLSDELFPIGRRRTCSRNSTSPETLDSSPPFRDAFKTRRCLIPTDTHFEWTTSPVDGKKDPWPLHLPEHRGFSFAGLWAHNDNLDVTSCTIITAPAVENIEHIHGRMPVILEESAYDAWLSGEAQGTEAKRLLLNNHLDSQLEFFRVGREVNNSRYEGTNTKKPIINAL